MKKKLIGMFAVLLALILTPVVGLTQSELQQGANLMKEGLEIKNKAKSRADLERSLKKLEDSQKIFERVKSTEGQAYSLAGIGQVYNALGQYAKALDYFDRSLTNWRKIGALKEEGITLNEIALVLASLGDYSQALQHSERSLAIARRIPDLNIEGAALNTMALVYRSLCEYDRALDYCQKSLPITRKIGNVKGEGDTLDNIGRAYQSLGQFDKALEYYNQSLIIRQKVGDVNGEGTTLNNIGEIYRSWAQYSKALDHYEKSLTIKRKTGDTRSEGSTLNNIGLTYSFWGQYAKALDYFEKSLVVWRKIGDLNSEADTLNNIAVVCDARGQYENALAYFEKCLAITRKIGDLKGESTNLNNMGLVNKSLGRYAQALECYEKSLEISKKIGDAKGQGIILTNTGQVHSLWGKYAEALDYYEKSLDIAKKVGDVRQQGTTLNDIGFVYQSAGQYAKALEYYDKSKAITGDIKDVKQEAVTLNQIGCLSALMGSYKDAEESIIKAIQIQQKIGAPVSGAKNDLANLYLDTCDFSKAESLVESIGYASTQGRLALLKGDYPSAAKFYEKDADLAEKTGNVDSLFRSCTGLARVYEEMGNYQKAEEYYEKAMNLTEEIRSGLLPSERRNFFEVKIQGLTRLDPARGLTRVGLKLNRTTGGIETSELTKARTFSDHLGEIFSNGSSGIPRDTLEKEQSLVTRLASLKKNLAKTDREKQPEKYDSLSKQVKASQTELNTFVDKLWKQNQAYAAAKYPRPVSLSQSALKTNECVVMFDVLGEGVGVKVILDKKISRVFYTKWDQKDLEKDVTKFCEFFHKDRIREFDPDLAKSLYDRLLLQALESVPECVPIIIIPDGILALLPFDALVTGGKALWRRAENLPEKYSDYPEGLTFLGDKHPISYYQSLTALTLVRTLSDPKNPGNKMLVVADPVFEAKNASAQTADQKEIVKSGAGRNIREMVANEEIRPGLIKLNLPSLPETSLLADNLRKMYGADCEILKGLKANKADFMQTIGPRIDRYGSVIFATHGAMTSNTPGLMEPFLVLSMVPPGTDGVLKMSDILTLKMNADIVALTACQTALGKVLSGEGVMSMGRAFQYAGAKSVLMSLWSVEEKSAVTLTENFFRYRKDGKTKLEALQSAKNDIRDAGYKHPYFWSAFILVGETQ